MSTPKPAQALPEHIIIENGKHINCDVYQRDIVSLKEYAKDRQFDLESECRKQYNVPVEWITHAQHTDLIDQIIRFHNTRLLQNGWHHHRCFDCGKSEGCSDKDCTKGEEIECRACHEGAPPATTRWLHNKAAIMI
jgi:hypothetical protein